MFRLIRMRLILSYAGIALLVTLCLGAVLLFRLRAYYTGMELDYLRSNAKAIGGLAAPMLINRYPKDIQDAQVSNLAFLSQTRVRILDPNKNVLSDSGPWQNSKIGFGVVKASRINGPEEGNLTSLPSSVIVVQKRTIAENGTTSGGLFMGNTVSRPVEPGAASAAPHPLSDGKPGIDQPNVIFFGSGVPVSNGVYGTYISKPNSGFIVRSIQKVVEPISDSLGGTLGYVELSESPAYGREIVSSVASGLAVAGSLAILLAVIAGWLTSRRLTAPLLNLTDATEQMSAGDLSVRVSEAVRTDEFGSLGKSFNQMAGRIEETVQTLRRFLADAAHELQTPLTALRTNLELARGEEDHAAADRYLANALEQIERLQRLIKDLLNLSHLESGNGREIFQRVDLNDLIRQASEPFAACAEQAGKSFDLDLPSGEAPVQGSPEKLRSALGNLLDNAIKFTPAGGAIAVCLSQEGQTLRLSVTDTGIGIPSEEIEMLFNRFHRARNATTYPGSGLGLAIVRAVAQAHGGSVKAENTPRGACFTLILPKA